MLPRVSSQSLVSGSCASSVHDRQSQSCLPLSRSSSVGPVKGRESVDLGRSQADLYTWVHFWESLERFSSVQGMTPCTTMMEVFFMFTLIPFQFWNLDMMSMRCCIFVSVWTKMEKSSAYVRWLKGSIWRRPWDIRLACPVVCSRCVTVVIKMRNHIGESTLPWETPVLSFSWAPIPSGVGR